jgi:glycosyltransferase involved in cell wall biosynthesis
VSRDGARRQLNVEDRFVIAYVGSFGGWYMTDEMMDFFASARDAQPSTFALVLTQRDVERAKALLRGKGFDDPDFLVTSVEPARLPEYLIAADVALSFIKPCYSKLSSSPTKIAEYLACGLPVASNRGIGDLDDLVQAERVGALIEDFAPASYRSVLETIGAMTNVRERCYATARRMFDLSEVAGRRYRMLYNRLSADDDARTRRKIPH